MSNLEELSGLKKCNYLSNESSKKSQEEDDEGGRYYSKRLKQSKMTRKVAREGEYLDVISFLSNNGNTDYLVKSDGSFIPLNFVKGKHLVICCVSLPFSDDEDDSEPYWRAILETYSSHKNDFEMVVAVTIPNNNEKAVFDDFLSYLPCLAIPFYDLDTRNSICSFIGFQDSLLSAIVVSPTGIILHCSDTTSLFHTYGFESFTSNESDIRSQDNILRFRLDPFHKKLNGQHDVVLRKPLSLCKDILMCPPSCVLSTLSGRSLTVSQLSKKYVGLYLCINTHFFGQLHLVHDKCIENKQELEIVLVCLPIYTKPKEYYEELIDCPAMKNWFILPNDNDVSRRLWRVFGFEEPVDKFIILPPKCKRGELAGRTMVQHFARRGIDAYPFTRSEVFKQWLAALKSVTAASLFKGACETTTCLVQNNAVVVPHSVIKGKKLLLYFDRIQLSDKKSKIYRLLRKNYPKIRAMGCEVVYIPLNKSAADAKLAKTPWLMMPVEAVVKDWETIQLFLEYDDQYMGRFRKGVVAVGEDGRILSIHVKKELKSCGVNEYLFRDTLREDIIQELDKLENHDDEMYA